MIEEVSKNKNNVKKSDLKGIYGLDHGEFCTSEEELLYGESMKRTQYWGHVPRFSRESNKPCSSILYSLKWK